MAALAFDSITVVCKSVDFLLFLYKAPIEGLFISHSSSKQILAFNLTGFLLV
jgi:hypothetical protein